MNERIKILRKTLHLTQDEFAKRIGSVQNTITGYESGRRTPSNPVVSSICKEFNVNEEWLRTGEGEMFIPQSDDEKIAAFIGDISSGTEDNFKKRLISILADLPVEGWEMIEQFARELVKDKN